MNEPGKQHALVRQSSASVDQRNHPVPAHLCARVSAHRGAGSSAAQAAPAPVQAQPPARLYRELLAHNEWVAVRMGDRAWANHIPAEVLDDDER